MTATDSTANSNNQPKTVVDLIGDRVRGHAGNSNRKVRSIIIDLASSSDDNGQ